MFCMQQLQELNFVMQLKSRQSVFASVARLFDDAELWNSMITWRRMVTNEWCRTELTNGEGLLLTNGAELN